MRKHVFFHILIVLAPIVLFGWLFWRYVTPSGVRAVEYTMGEVSPFVQRLLPDARVSAVQERDGDAYVTLLDEPVYFSVTPPAGNFERVTVEIAFDPGGTPTLELGGLRDVAAQAFDFRPLSNALLEDLAWTHHTVANGLVLFSRNPRSTAHETFLTNPPDRANVAAYRATYPTPFRITDYRPLGATQKFDVSLRGSHELLTYVKSETFALDLEYSDINRTYGADSGFVKVIDEYGDIMTEFIFRDDGNIYDNQNSSKDTISLRGEDWDEGVYRIVLSGTSDIVWRSLATSQRYLVVKNTVFIGDEVGYLPDPRSTTLYTNAKRMTFETQHVEGLQTIRVGASGEIQLHTVQGKQSINVSESGVVPVISPVGDVKVTGEGKYAFTRSAFFDPDPIPFTAFTNLEDVDVEYVIANLSGVKYKDGWRVASAAFDVSSLAVENGAYKFALSAPGVREGLGEVAVHGVTVTFEKSPLSWRTLWPECKRIIRRLLP